MPFHLMQEGKTCIHFAKETSIFDLLIEEGANIYHVDENVSAPTQRQKPNPTILDSPLTTFMYLNCILYSREIIYFTHGQHCTRKAVICPSGRRPSHMICLATLRMK